MQRVMEIYDDHIDVDCEEEEMFYDGLACPPMEAFDFDFLSRDHPPMNLDPNVFFRDQIFHEEKDDAGVVGGHDDQIPKQQKQVVMGVGKGKELMRFVQIFKPRNHGDLDYVKRCVREELFGESSDDGGDGDDDDEEKGYVEEAVEEQEKMKKLLDEFVIQQKFELTKRKRQDQTCQQHIKDEEDAVHGHAQIPKRQQQEEVMGVGKGKELMRFVQNFKTENQGDLGHITKYVKQELFGESFDDYIEEQDKSTKLLGEFAILQKFESKKKRKTHDRSYQQSVNEEEKFELRKRKTHDQSYQQSVNEEEKFELWKRKTHDQSYQQSVNEEQKFELRKRKTHDQSYQQSVNEEEKFELRKRKTHDQSYQQSVNEEQKFELARLKMQESYQRINMVKKRKRVQVFEALKSLVSLPAMSTPNSKPMPKPKHKEPITKKKNLRGRKSYLHV